MFQSHGSRRAFVGSTVALLAAMLPFRNRRAEAIDTGSYCLSSYEWEMLTLVNNYRAANGVGPLRMSAALSAAAEHHSRDMVRQNYFGHTLSDGRSWATNIRDHGYTANTTIGENIAAGNSTASATFNQWRNSSGHRANMLASKYTALGVGRNNGKYAKYVYYWTTTFGGTRDGSAC